MSKETLELSRRKILAGLGTAGIAAAGAGLGTTAWLNDEESFTGNQLVAGTLDLKVDWQQAYYGPSESLVPVNAYPDHDGDGLQSIDDNTEYVLGSGETEGDNVPIDLSCADLESGANLPADVFASPNRTTANGGPIDQQGSLVSLDDVKPGDWGEITFSLHLCDNPGYVWMMADNVTESGGVTTEPESALLGQGDTDAGELAENVNVEIWYDDNCDNVRQAGTTGNDAFADVVIVLDRSGSMSDDDLNASETAANSLISALGDDDQVGLVSFSTTGAAGGTDDSALEASLTTDHASVQTAVNNLGDGGRTNMEAAVERAHEELLAADTFPSDYTESGNARPGAQKYMVFLSDGEANEGTAVTDALTNESPIEEATNAKADGIEIFTIAYGNPSSTAVNTLQGMASSPQGDHYFTADVTNVVSVFQSIGGSVGGAETLILGEGDGVHTSPVTLREAFDVMANNDGMIPLDGTGDMGYGEGDTSPERDCFPARSMHCIGVRWWVPGEVGNEIQGDSISFDLGFYAEQCRHNDGSRPTPVPSITPTQTPQ